MIRLSDSHVVWFDLVSEARVGRAGQDVVIEWVGFLRMTASPESERARIEPLVEGLDPEVVKKVEGFARALPAYLRGGVVFHAAAVGVSDRGLLILGESGAGKSTTAALLCDNGAALVADDTTLGLLEGSDVWLQPIETDHWLDESSRAALARGDDVVGKRPVAAARTARPVKLAAAVLLEPHDSTRIEITRLRGLQSASALLNCALRLPLDAERSKRDLDRLAQIADRIPVYRALRPREFSSNLKELPSRLLELLSRP